MRAEISDAPERVTRKRHRPNVFYALICVAIGGIASIGAVGLTNRAPGIDSNHKQLMSQPARDDQLTRASDMPPGQGLDSSWLRASTQVRAPGNTARQTAFNDQNFTPRGADNIVAFAVSSRPASQDKPAKTAKLTIVRQSPSMKERACWPYRQGSIELRNCRFSVGLKHRD